MKKSCSNCGSTNIRVDAYVRWSGTHQRYMIDEVNEDVAFCGECDGDTKVLDDVPKIMIPREETWTVTTAMVSETSSGIIGTEDNVELEITVGIKQDTNGEWFGWFELDGGEDWYAEGGIDLDGKDVLGYDGVVVGYDGVFELSSYVINKLKSWGFNCDDVE